MKILNAAFVLLFFLNSSLSFSEEIFGKCIHDPDADLLQKKWQHYHTLLKKRADINIFLLVRNAKASTEMVKFIRNISEVEKLMIILDELQDKYLRKAFVDTRFNELISSPDFITKILKKDIDIEIKTSQLPFRNDEHFYELLEAIRTELARPEIGEALASFRESDLGVLQAEYRKSAKLALNLIRKKGGSLEAVRGWVNDPPYLRNIPLPQLSIGPFALKYRLLLATVVSEFVTDRDVTLKEAKKKFPKIKQDEVDEMNAIEAPTETNSFDDHIALKTSGVIEISGNRKITANEFNAIDGVARTLWGEAASCQNQGMPQFEAIGRIITDRSLAVCRALNEQDEIVKKNEEVHEQNWTTVLKNWVGIKRPAPGLKNKATPKLRGFGDFGRKEMSKIHCAAQVISKKNQFSVWNSYNLIKYHTGKKHKNIPDSVYEIKGPQASNDDKALVRILCPEFLNNTQKELWNHALEISKQIVLEPNKLGENIRWPVNGDILFYTHEAPLPFAKEVQVHSILINGKSIPLRKNGNGPCDNFRLFVPKTKMQY
jgi:hypothetical protein